MAKRKTKTKPPLRLEWIEAGSLAENPSNWRRHSEEQLQTVRELLDDPDIGWAGACLYNERTKRLIDGHARKNVVDPKTPIPVLVGSWTPEAEKKILLTLDPAGGMATGDTEAFELLAAEVNADGLWVRDLLHQTAADMDRHESDGDDDEDLEAGEVHPDMECQPFEHYDYIMLMFRDRQDFDGICELLGIKKVQLKYPGGLQKIGLGRVIEGPAAIRKIRKSKGGGV